ncbi:MAG TPA: SUF system NifU family Fe-S cluster assembly protein [Bacteroidota bacterium]|nr:SUF system NifU family Fe-S cluster assembly protein [Bacteroidota bacterium]
MTDPNLRLLYQEVILDHNRYPRNYRAMPDATQSLEGFNPLCGDRYTIFVKLRDGIIEDISFLGAGCAISKASASVMCSVLKGKSVEDAEELFGRFHRLVTGQEDATQHEAELGKLAAFGGVSEFPMRVKCASLAWHTMKGVIESRSEKVSTE